MTSLVERITGRGIRRDTPEGEEDSKEPSSLWRRPTTGAYTCRPSDCQACDEGDIEHYDSEALWGFADALSQAAAVKVR